ncbi:uncharacterized protein CTRU02_200199 [Colletotrichum truncatum]|uniref:Uncharacterized protein n=1 Tax=Colletotrichum truncatum TaxID=5467 RepID=A0ACC3ZDT7_COLTU|nr:uncharacterized protein CTRU02_05078 [Colletotrichum truncatum]KAF6794877.1 hypothetical protein CTRU02_05078 [Colletotrichum truncatum]
MAKKVYSRTVVEEAPSHDGKICYAAWKLTESDPDVRTSPEASNRPKWSIQVYDTTPMAGDREHIITVAQKLEESTRQGRDRRGAPNRIEVHGLPLHADTPENERVARCTAHHRAEVAERNATGVTDFFIPPTFDDTWKHRVLIIDKPEGSWDESEKQDGAFLAVFFDLQPQARAEDPDGSDLHSIRFTGADLVENLRSFTKSIEWFYESYVEDGTIYRDLEKWQQKA